jgi:hypothetical protein
MFLYSMPSDTLLFIIVVLSISHERIHEYVVPGQYQVTIMTDDDLTISFVAANVSLTVANVSLLSISTLSTVANIDHSKH